MTFHKTRECLENWSHGYKRNESYIFCLIKAVTLKLEQRRSGQSFWCPATTQQENSQFLLQLLDEDRRCSTSSVADPCESVLTRLQVMHHVTHNPRSRHPEKFKEIRLNFSVIRKRKYPSKYQKGGLVSNRPKVMYGKQRCGGYFVNVVNVETEC